ncbi:MAG: carboxypeptidase regulatory-like domain-containing protein [Candidatus Hydrogenedentes bacterium]|nr:carboxypeptidase regulatory-like domain-containing protein [Candidatus Hydrogenedentota bacterium]
MGRFVETGNEGEVSKVRKASLLAGLAVTVIGILILWWHPWRDTADETASQEVDRTAAPALKKLLRSDLRDESRSPAVQEPREPVASVEPPAAKGETILIGQVIAADSGAAVPNARVVAKADLEPIQRRRMETGTTDEEGRFRISGLSPGAYSVTLGQGMWQEGDKSGGWVAAESPKKVTCAAPGTYDAGVIRAALGGGIAGRVTDSNDQTPVEGAQVFAFPSGGGEGRDAKSDSDGLYHLTGLPAGSFEVGVQAAPNHYAAGHLAVKTVIVQLGRESSGVDFELAVGVSLRGRVVYEQNAAAAKAEVYLFSANGNAHDKNTTSDDAGRFVLENLPPNQSIGLLAKSKDAVSDLATAVTPQAPPSEEVLLTLVSGSTIAGRVLDQSGRPIAGAGVCAERADPSSFELSLSAFTDAKGAYRLQGLPPGSYALWAAPPDEVVTWPHGAPNPDAILIEMMAGLSSEERAKLPKDFSTEMASKIRDLGLIQPNPYHAMTDANHKSPKQQVQLASGQRLERVDLILGQVPSPGTGAGAAIAGHVFDTDGQPFDGAAVLLMAEESDSRSWLQRDSVRTDASGAFRFTIHDTERYMVEARAGDPGAGADVSSIVVTAGTEDIQLTLPRSISVSGQVVDAEDHRPIADFNIGFKPGLQNSPGDWTTQRSTSPMAWTFRPGPPSNMLHVRDADGRFHLDGVPGFPTTLFIQAPGHYIGAAQLTASPRQAVTVALQRSAPISGVITGPNNEPVSGAKVYIGRFPENDTTGFVASGADGRFTLDAVFPIGENVVWGIHPTYAPASARIARGATTVSLHLTVPCTLQGRVTLDGSGKKGVFVNATSGEGEEQLRRSAETGNDGEFIIRSLPQGICAVHVGYSDDPRTSSSLEFFESRATVTLSPETSAVLELPLEHHDLSSQSTLSPSAQAGP